MRNKHVKSITEKLELLNEKQLEAIGKEVESFAELSPASPREKLFRRVQDSVQGISDVKIKNEHGVVTGIGATLVYDKQNDENVSLCYMLDTDQLELVKNLETILTIAKDSPVLEAFQEVFNQLELEDKEK